MESCKKLYDFNYNLKHLQGEELEEYKNNVDYLSIGVVDEDTMGKIVKFIER